MRCDKQTFVDGDLYCDLLPGRKFAKPYPCQTCKSEWKTGVPSAENPTPTILRILGTPNDHPVERPPPVATAPNPVRPRVYNSRHDCRSPEWIWTYLVTGETEPIPARRYDMQMWFFDVLDGVGGCGC